jgi:peptide/nickel transport system ATP-binding protein
VGTQIIEALTVHNPTMSKQAKEARAVDLLRMVGIPSPKDRLKAFPHEFSGGMRQRVMIAIAIANDPRVLVADEPTTALDVTIQAQVLEVLHTAQEETGAAVVMITHDLGVVAGMADDIMVMYAGKPVETGTVEDIYYNPRMPYTLGLLGAVPRIDTAAPWSATPACTESRNCSPCPELRAKPWDTRPPASKPRNCPATPTRTRFSTRRPSPFRSSTA